MGPLSFVFVTETFTGTKSFETLEVYRLAERLSVVVWRLV